MLVECGERYITSLRARLYSLYRCRSGEIKAWPNITVKKAPPPDSKEWEGSRTNSNTSHQIPARAIEADSVRPLLVPGPKIRPTDPTGRSSGRITGPSKIGRASCRERV